MLCAHLVKLDAFLTPKKITIQPCLVGDAFNSSSRTHLREEDVSDETMGA
jgi:hypothetical protein